MAQADAELLAKYHRHRRLGIWLGLAAIPAPVAGPFLIASISTKIPFEAQSGLIPDQMMAALVSAVVLPALLIIAGLANFSITRVIRINATQNHTHASSQPSLIGAQNS